LLTAFIQETKNFQQKKFLSFKWNIEFNLQKEADKTQAIRECYSDSTKADIFNLSSTLSPNKLKQTANAGVYLSKVFEEEDEGHHIESYQEGSMILIKK
jgi:hypothetical protein